MQEIDLDALTQSGNTDGHWSFIHPSPIAGSIASEVGGALYPDCFGFVSLPSGA